MTLELTVKIELFELYKMRTLFAHIPRHENMVCRHLVERKNVEREKYRKKKYRKKKYRKKKYRKKYIEVENYRKLKIIRENAEGKQFSISLVNSYSCLWSSISWSF